ncbi:hypothetical protein Vafri_16910 [Volvox africanus]|uniref:ubiquitinyl hydrolase 1 n=1 Tax=Volvox africanus TaxID=51714 RepID=A0A8J4F798_9CHLO|nr:hypothetical protein Vafri_16910 [Volvox africanus]
MVMMNYTLKGLSQIPQALIWIRKYPTHSLRTATATVFYITLCWQLASAKNMAPILASNIPAVIAGLPIVPNITPHANLVISICTVVGTAMPTGAGTQSMIPSIVTPLTVAVVWNRQTRINQQTANTTKPDHTTHPQCAGPQEPAGNYPHYLQTPIPTPQKITWPPTKQRDHTKPLYHEKQQAQMCMIHAINNLLGGPAIDPWNVLNYCRAMLTHMKENNLNDAATLWRAAHDPHTGYYSTLTINHYLRYAITAHNPGGAKIRGKHITTVTKGTTISNGS